MKRESSLWSAATSRNGSQRTSVAMVSSSLVVLVYGHRIKPKRVFVNANDTTIGAVIEVGDRLRGRHFTRINDWNHDELRDALDLADRLKVAQKEREPHRLLEGRTVALI